MKLGRLSGDLSLKLFSLLVSVVLFLFVSAESSTPVDVEFPLQYRTPDDMLITSDVPGVLSVTLRGPWAKYRSFEGGDLEPVNIDLIEAEPGLTRYRIETRDIKAPAGMDVVAISSSELEVNLDRRIEKQISVEVDLIGRPAFGYEIAKVESEPQRVRVVGPKTKMQTLDFVYTRPVDIRERDKSVRSPVELRPPASPMQLADIRGVEVFVEIREEMLIRNMVVPVRLDNEPRGSSVAPETVLVSIKGPRRIVDKLEKDQLVAVVDVLQEVQQSKQHFQKSIQLVGLPDRTEVAGALPKVDVSLRRPSRRRLSP